MAAKVKDKVMTVAAIARTVEATMAVAVAAAARTLSAMASSPGPRSWPSFYNHWTRGAALTPPSVVHHAPGGGVFHHRVRARVLAH
jgi:hypothetical protein